MAVTTIYPIPGYPTMYLTEDRALLHLSAPGHIRC